jgi:hypothetical protein
MEFELAPRGSARQGRDSAGGASPDEGKPAIVEPTDRPNDVRHIVHGNPTFAQAPADVPFTPAGSAPSQEQADEDELLFMSAPYGAPPRK